MAEGREPRFASFDEWQRAADHAPPRRTDDTPVLAGQTGKRRRATREELLALIAEQRAKHARRA